MKYDKNNIFARILRKELPAQVVYEDEYALAFHDIAPKAPVHILVIPKGSYVSFFDFSEKASSAEITGFTKAIHNVIASLDLEDKGFWTLSSHGEEGGQVIFHYHVHICSGRRPSQMALLHS
ncbi:MAG: HIT domain-containing protein [Alphaproteobacteria bacterium]|nr:HIT domain-containing protein [Alphaproteobacteria bacterium]